MRYKIGQEVAEMTSAKGNKFKKFNTRSEAGVITEGVVSFSTFSQYANVVAGAEIEGVLTESDYNGRKSFTLKDGNLGAKSFGGGAVAMERKEKSIAKFQDAKEYSIMVASTAKMATEIVVTLIDRPLEITEEAWKKRWLEIRYWLVKNWENIEQPKVAGTDIDYPQNNDTEIPF